MPACNDAARCIIATGDDDRLQSIEIGPQLRTILRERREELALTQTQLGEADRFGSRISTETISRFETGRRTASRPNVLAALVLRLGLTPHDLASLDDGYPRLAHLMAHLARKAGPGDPFSWEVMHGGEDLGRTLRPLETTHTRGDASRV